MFFLVPLSNGVFSTSFIYVVFFLSICSTFQGSLVSLVCQRSNFVLPLPFPLLSGAFPRISGRDPLLVWESCDAPRPELRMPSSYSEFRRVFLLCLLFYLCIASCHHAIYFFKTQLNKLHRSFDLFKPRELTW